MQRAASSSMAGLGWPPRSSMRSSAWTGPLVSPSARAACPAVRTAAARTGPGSREGVTSRVSSKVGPSGRGGLVEDGGDGQVAAGQQAVDAQLRAGQVFLDQQRLLIGAPGGGQDLPDPPGRGHGGGRVVGAQDALAGAERDRLDHAREPHRSRPHRRMASSGAAAGTIREARAGPRRRLPTAAAAGPCRWRSARPRPGCAAAPSARPPPPPAPASGCPRRPRRRPGRAGQDAAGAAVRVGRVDRDDRAAAHAAARRRCRSPGPGPSGRRPAGSRPRGRCGRAPAAARAARAAAGRRRLCRAVIVSPGRRTARFPLRGR